MHLVLAACFLLPAPAPAPAAPPSSLDGLPIKVTSDNMTYDTDKNVVVFKGSVEAQRGTFYLWASQLTLYLKPAGSQPQAAPAEAEAGPALNPGDLDRLVAEKNVRFRYNTQTGTAEKATYTTRDGLLVMEGNPVIRDGDNSITGHTIRYFLHENRSEVVGGSTDRVQAIFSSNNQKGR